MESIPLALATLISLVAVLSLSIRGRRAAARLDRIDTGRLDAIIQESEQVKRACFLSLENMQRSLDALQSRAEAAERRAAGADHALQLERQGRYQAAALLLEGGQSVERVAAMIDLPADHVTLVQELRRVLAKDSARRTARTGAEAAPDERKKRGARERVRPILLTDVVDFDIAAGGRNGCQSGDHGAAA